ncbi:hypothetical protein FRB95_006776 [Tulasnella sp. JGI-2019a]|nr:hypothetical protein FRB95_006776 [Tulasnella sp. JGI-2019a]
MNKKQSGRALTIVIKLGTSSIVHETTHQPLISLLSSVVETVLRLRSNGHRVVLVSSGAIGVGLKRMEMPERPKHLAGKQALAAIGQGRLIALWDNLFGQLGQPIAQILLTRGDISDRTRYLNAVNTLTELLSMGVVPIINENDTVSVSEIKFGDNDTLSAITSSMLHADYLFLLTDVESLYTSNPRKDPDARPVEEVTSVSDIRSQVSTATLGSHLGTGGMETKLIAAEIATGAGVSVIICSSKKVESISEIIHYNAKSLPLPVPSDPSAGSPTMGRLATIRTSTSHTNSPLVTGTHTPIRPPHTLFKPSSAPLRDLKLWTAHTLSPAGSVIIDAGAHHVLSRRESGGRLLAAGVIGVIGNFAGGQAVKIVIRRRKRAGHAFAVTTTTTVIDRDIRGGSDSATATVESDGTHHHFSHTRSSTVDTEDSDLLSLPKTPIIDPAYSLTSSIASLEPLTRPISTEDLHHAMLKASADTASLVAEQIDEDGGIQGLLPEETPRVTTVPLVTEPEEHPATAGAEEEWDIIEVGRGLVNYNSAEIQKVRGAKSSQVRQILGYADSEYVVENITIRVNP